VKPVHLKQSSKGGCGSAELEPPEELERNLSPEMKRAYADSD